ncbi:MAG: KH domain-containing protein [Lachnospiraceae bacterium]|nr:KH domain-containing protein [Lachnospiraceae bacterium]
MSIENSEKNKLTKEEVAKNALSFLKGFFENTEDKADISYTYDEKNEILFFNINCGNAAQLIGKRGSTIDSLQFITNIVANKGNSHNISIVIDTQNYREKRKASLDILADTVARKVIKQKKDTVLESMNPSARRIIHRALDNVPHIVTETIGEEPNKKVVIKYVN